MTLCCASNSEIDLSTVYLEIQRPLTMGYFRPIWGYFFGGIVAHHYELLGFPGTPELSVQWLSEEAACLRLQVSSTRAYGACLFLRSYVGSLVGDRARTGKHPCSTSGCPGPDRAPVGPRI